MTGVRAAPPQIEWRQKWAGWHGARTVRRDANSCHRWPADLIASEVRALLLPAAEPSARRRLRDGTIPRCHVHLTVVAEGDVVIDLDRSASLVELACAQAVGLVEDDIPAGARGSTGGSALALRHELLENVRRHSWCSVAVDACR